MRKIDIRRSQIMNLLRQQGSVRVAALSNLFGRTKVTIRNDLIELERKGHLIRKQGGAILPPKRQKEETDIDLLDVKNAAEKQAIASAVAKKIRDGDTLFINSGITTLLVAQALKEHSELNIVTNSLVVAKLLGQIPSFRVLLLGGKLNVQYGFTSGGDALNQLRRFQADWAILSVDGVSAENGLTTRHVESSVIDRMMIAKARNTCIVADHSKIGRASFAQITTDLNGIGLITGSADEHALVELKQCGMDVVCVYQEKENDYGE